MSGPRLSICIPTYNRASHLHARLTQLVGLLEGVPPSEVQVLVADNGSPDDSLNVAHAFHGRLPSLRVLESPRNYGADFNFAKCMQEADGEWVWLFSDDDELLEGSVRGALDYIRSGRYHCVVANQEMGLTYSCRQVFGERTFSIQTDREGTSSQLTGSLGFLNLLGFVSALIFRRPQFGPVDWMRHIGYDSALIHSTVVYEQFAHHRAVVTAIPLLKVEPPASHQTREHQIAQDPRVDFRMWTLNITRFLTDMLRSGAIAPRDQAADSTFFEVRHCRMRLGSHVLGSFQTCISEAREIPDLAWSKLREFLTITEDRDNLDKLERLRGFHDQLFEQLHQIRRSPETREGILHQIHTQCGAP